MFSLTTFVQYWTESSNKCDKIRKRNKRSPDGKRRKIVSIFTDDII